MVSNIVCGLVAGLMMAGVVSGQEATVAGSRAGATQPAGGVASSQPAWKAAADARIEQHRKGDFELRLVLAGGEGGAAEAVAGAEVRIEQTGHGFLFGTCINALATGRGEASEKYRAFVLRHFNCVVLENDMKWYSIEKRPGVLTFDAADAQLAFAEKHGLAVRGHCLLWDVEKWVHGWVRELEVEALREAVFAQIERTARRYAGRVFCWDVSNEMLDGGFYAGRLGAAVNAEVFKAAAKADPGAVLFVNEYSILADEAKTERYIKLVEGLRAAGAPVGGIGIQEHGCERFVVRLDAEGKPIAHHKHPSGTPEAMFASLERMASLGLPIHLTEISANSLDDGIRAEALDILFRVGFSHPQVEAILLWGFWERAHWLGKNASLVDAQFEPNAAGRHLTHLLEHEWRTRSRVRSDEAGRVRFRGFYGTYAVHVTLADGRTGSANVRLDRKARSATVRLELAGGQSGTGEPGEPVAPVAPDSPMGPGVGR